MEAEAESHDGGYCSARTDPGAGFQDELWVVDLQTSNAARLVALRETLNPSTAVLGTLHPHFSPNGTKLLWAELYGVPDANTPGWEVGRFRLMIGDVAVDASSQLPALSNKQQLLPTATSGEGFLESHGFSADGTRIIFSGNLGYGQNVLTRSDEWSARLDGTDLQALTHSDYNELGEFSPVGQRLFWMSNRWQEPSFSFLGEGTEFYVANSDGTGICRATYFNTPGHPESQTVGPTACAKSSWAPDGQRLALYTRAPHFASQDVWILTFASPP